MSTQLQILQELLNKTIEEKKKIERTVYYDDFERAFKELIAFVKDVKTQIDSSNLADKKSIEGEINTLLTKALSDIETAQKDLDAKFGNLKGFVESDLRTSFRLLQQTAEDIKDVVPEAYDDTELAEKLEEISEKIELLKIPEAFDATELSKEIEQLKKDVDELKNRPIGRGGQVTDKAVQFALMRSIQAVTPTGTIDGVNATFTVPSTIHAVLSFELNSRVVALGEYTITGSARKTIVFDTAPSVAYSGKSFIITYI